MAKRGDMKATDDRRRIAPPELPPWESFPDIELYMDQVISLMTRYLEPFPDDGGKPLTASMVNNYVKTGLVPPPERKRYTREHLAYLLIVCMLKPILPLASIRTMLDRELANAPIKDFYDEFRRAAAQTASAAQTAYGSDDAPALHSALRARAERDLAIALYERHEADL